jgi:hypothetical protein
LAASLRATSGQASRFFALVDTPITGVAEGPDLVAALRASLVMSWTLVAVATTVCTRSDPA